MVKLEINHGITQVPDTERPEGRISLGQGDSSLQLTQWAQKVQQQFEKIQKLMQRQDDHFSFPVLPSIGTEDCVGTAERDSAVSSIRFMHRFYNFSADTFAAAISYLDRFLSKVKVKQRYLSCVTAAAYFLSAKMNEETEVCPSASELASLHRFIWKPSDLKRMEKILLDKLGWNLWPPATCLSFLTPIFGMMQVVQPDLDEDFFTHLVSKSEVFLNHSRCAGFKPATLAVSIVQQCLKELGHSSLVTQYLILHIQAACQISDSELFECQCAISQQLELYNLHPATHPSCLPLPKPVPRPSLMRRPSFYGSTDLPTIDEMPLAEESSEESDSDVSSDLQSPKDLHEVSETTAEYCAIRGHFFSEKFGADDYYSKIKCNISKS